MAYPHIETDSDYAEYKDAVDTFFKSEGIENLSSGHIYCPDCNDKTDEAIEHWLETGQCKDCEASRECMNEPHFSWSRCECCNHSLGGDREHCTGYHRESKQIFEYSVCSDCVYFAEYGQLDDMTMTDMKMDIYLEDRDSGKGETRLFSNESEIRSWMDSEYKEYGIRLAAYDYNNFRMFETDAQGKVHKN